MKLNSGWLYTILLAAVLYKMLVTAVFSSRSITQERKVTMPPSELPVVIRNAIEQVFPEGQIIAIQKEVEGEDPGRYDVEMRSDGKEYEIEISPEGKVIEIEEKTPAAKIAEAKQGRKWTITRTAR